MFIVNARMPGCMYMTMPQYAHPQPARSYAGSDGRAPF